MPKPRGRPSGYSPSTADRICELIAEGRSLVEICQMPDMPGMTTIFRWLPIHDDFRQKYATAREAQADHMAEEILDIADNAQNDWMERNVGDGQTESVINSEHIARSRLRIDSRKWLMSKLQPKKYGDKLDVEHGGNLTMTHDIAAMRQKAVAEIEAAFEEVAALPVSDGSTTIN